VHHHLEEGDGGDTNVFEVVGIGFPWLGFTDCFLFCGIVTVEGIFLGIDKLNIVVELCLEIGSALNQNGQIGIQLTPAFECFIHDGRRVGDFWDVVGVWSLEDISKS
jgi:hypothetical protein